MALNLHHKKNIHGVLLLDKDKGITSNKALQQIKHLFHAKKAGHTGSLDPIATGILPICFGEATKFATYLLADSKTYIATIRLGQKTTTLDSEGEITHEYSTAHITKQLVLQTLEKFVGIITQIPPMYSALKVAGTPLYKLAREGKEITRKKRTVEIYSISLLSFKNNILSLEVHASKGTYIRTLADDIGSTLHSGAHITELRRTKFGAFDIIHTHNYEKLSTTSKSLDSYLLPISSIISDFMNVNITDEQFRNLQYGRNISYLSNLDNDIIVGNTVKLFFNNVFVGIGITNEEYITPKRLINFEFFNHEFIKTLS